MTRHDQITALLRSLFDYLPDPKTASYGDIPGVAPSEWADCKPCGGVGTFGKVKRPCAACEGKGTVKIDSYTGEPVGTDDRKVRSASRQRIDSELAKLANDEAARRGAHIDDPFAWEARRIQYRQAGSYASVERALDSLRANEPDLCSLVMRCLVYGVSPVTEDSQPHLSRALDFIARRMPAEVRVPRWVTDPPPVVEREWKAGRTGSGQRPAKQERNAKIIALAQDGRAQADIAKAVGCSTATVSRVLSAVQLAGTAA